MHDKLRIDEIYAFIAIDRDGTEGIPAFVGPPLEGGELPTMMPMICADEARVASVRPIAERESARLGIPFKLVKFSTRTELETIGTVPPDKVV